MKPIQGIDLKECYEIAEKELLAEKKKLVVDAIKRQINGAAERKETAEFCSDLIEKIKGGMWDNININDSRGY